MPDARPESSNVLRLDNVAEATPTLARTPPLASARHESGFQAAMQAYYALAARLRSSSPGA